MGEHTASGKHLTKMSDMYMIFDPIFFWEALGPIKIMTGVKLYATCATPDGQNGAQRLNENFQEHFQTTKKITYPVTP